MVRQKKEWEELFRKSGAIWTHDGHQARPHVVLSSGVHSDGFANCEIVMKDSGLLHEAAWDLAEALEHSGLNLEETGRVIGPAMGAVTLSSMLALTIGFRRSRSCLCGFCEKPDSTGGIADWMAFKKPGNIKKGEVGLLTDDVFTTGRNLHMTADAVLREGGTIQEFLAVLVNRSGLTESGGRKIVSLVDIPMQTWDKTACPLCAAGSKAIIPEAPGNWELLTAEY
ncbi:MAG: hypothetical protein WCG97_03480 [bacterium]